MNALKYWKLFVELRPLKLYLIQMRCIFLFKYVSKLFQWNYFTEKLNLMCWMHSLNNCYICCDLFCFLLEASNFEIITLLYRNNLQLQTFFLLFRHLSINSHYWLFLFLCSFSTRCYIINWFISLNLLHFMWHVWVWFKGVKITSFI